MAQEILLLKQVSAFFLRNKVKVACERLKSSKAVEGSKGEPQSIVLPSLSLIMQMFDHPDTETFLYLCSLAALCSAYYLHFRASRLYMIPL